MACFRHIVVPSYREMNGYGAATVVLVKALLCQTTRKRPICHSGLCEAANRSQSGKDYGVIIGLLRGNRCEQGRRSVSVALAGEPVCVMTIWSAGPLGSFSNWDKSGG